MKDFVITDGVAALLLLLLFLFLFLFQSYYYIACRFKKDNRERERERQRKEALERSSPGTGELVWVYYSVHHSHTLTHFLYRSFSRAYVSFSSFISVEGSNNNNIFCELSMVLMQKYFKSACCA